ncbi:hypothetical protein KAI87_06770 [Myxococcota bacterium]|nr:hypothetical protein [Myxococcota bacterium]
MTEPSHAFTEILRTINQEKFIEVFSASSRKARETYLHRHGVKASTGNRLSKPGAKNLARASKLYDLLADKDDDEMCEEILRTWLLSKREMLAAALDHLEIENENGLTESDDVDKFEKLNKKELSALTKALEGQASKDDIAIYLRFMGNKEVELPAG